MLSMALSPAPYPPLTMPHEHYHLVPKELSANLEYRARILKEGGSSKSRAAELRQMSSEDFLWWANTFVWVHDPWITDGERVIPLITRPYQDNFLEGFYWAIIRQYDLHVRKCRRVLASIGCLTLFDWFASYSSDMSFLVMSAKERLVDGLAGKIRTKSDREGKRAALMPKIDLIHKYLPRWLRPEVYRKKLFIGYQETASEIEGTATVPDHGTRHTGMMADEMAFWATLSPGLDYEILEATRGSVRSRIMISTAHGMGNAFYEVEERGKTRKRRIFWWEDPVYRVGIHVGKDGELHSPWYDTESDRCGTPEERAGQLDGEYVGSGTNFFPVDIIHDRLKQTAPPMYVGNIDFSDGKFLGFSKGDVGPVSLWCELENDHPPRGEYAAGADIATGTPDAQGRGYSNSVLVIYSLDGNRKVLEYTISSLLPFEFASACVALMSWFSSDHSQDVYLAWESGGPGKEFGPMVQRYGWENFYLREIEHKLGQPPTMEPGYSTSSKGLKAYLLGNYRAALKRGDIKNLSRPALFECLEFLRGPGNEVFHKVKGGVNPRDKLTARHPHGDRTVADALAWLAITKCGAPAGKNEPHTIPGDCVWRRIMRQQSELKAFKAGEPTKDRKSYSWVA